MRFQSLKIQNLASLKNKHLVDFQGLSNDGLFSIVGPTGSGKSTILNAMSLALYGQLYKKSLNQTDLVTLGESHASAELSFQIYNKDYVAVWESRVLKKDGTPLKNPSTTRELFEVIDSKKQVTDQTVDELLGLDFNQFSKTIILNQGEFAKFLTSSFTERKDILEKLCHLENLKDLGKTLNLKVADITNYKNDKESELKAYLSNFTPIAPIKKELLSVQKELVDNKKKEAGVLKELDIFKQIKKVGQDFHSKRESLKANEKSREEHLKTYELIEEELHLIKKKYKDFKADYDKKNPELTQKIIQKESYLQKKNYLAKINTDQKKASEEQQNLQNKKQQKAQELKAAENELQALIQKRTNKLSLEELKNSLLAKSEQRHLQEKLTEQRAAKQSELSDVYQDTLSFVKTLSQINDNFGSVFEHNREMKKAQNDLTNEFYKKIDQSFLNSLNQLLKVYVKHAHTSDPCPVCEQKISKDDLARIKLRAKSADTNVRENIFKKMQRLDAIHHQIEKDYNNILHIQKNIMPIDTSKLKTINQKIHSINEQLDNKAIPYTEDLLKDEIKIVESMALRGHKIEVLQEQSKSLQELLTQKDLFLEESKKEYQATEKDYLSLERDLGVYAQNDPRQELQKYQTSLNQFELEVTNSQKRYNETKEKLNSLVDKSKFLNDQIKDYGLTYSDLKNKIKTYDFPTSLEDLVTDAINIVIDQLANKLESITNQITELNIRSGNLTQKTQSLTLIKEKIDFVKSELTKIESDLDPKIQLSQLLGRDEFRNYVLKRVEDMLITQANMELKNLCDNRYQIVVQASKNKINEFYILDRFKEGRLRKLATLSGGETFMASLAMAMALSELSRGTTEINAFFIDEGFATLDEDALDDVMDLLMRIKSRGKQVGVISHVEKLQQRIPSTLVLQKNQEGTSKMITQLGF